MYLLHDTEGTLCLSSGYGKDWKSVTVVPCSSSSTTATPSHELFRFDRRHRLRSVRFPKYCVGPTKDNIENNTELTLVLCKDSKSSWLRSSDGYLTLSGSNKVISVGTVVESGQIPFLLDIDATSTLQQWKTGLIDQ
jgi:hypothetical protein